MKANTDGGDDSRSRSPVAKYRRANPIANRNRSAFEFLRLHGNIKRSGGLCSTFTGSRRRTIFLRRPPLPAKSSLRKCHGCANLDRLDISRGRVLRQRGYTSNKDIELRRKNLSDSQSSSRSVLLCATIFQSRTLDISRSSLGPSLPLLLFPNTINFKDPMDLKTPKFLLSSFIAFSFKSLTFY